MRPGLSALATVALTALLVAPSPVLSARRPPSLAPTPVLLERAVTGGELDRATADMYLAAALTPAYREVPGRYLGQAPWEGTPWLLELRERLREMPRGPSRAAVREALSPTDNCQGLTGPFTLDSTHLHIHFTAFGGGLDESDYAQSLETAWSTEVDSFGWAAPPLSGTSGYLVAVAPLGALFGFVTPTGTVGNNPNTAWEDGDAQASCMVLNSDYGGFPPSTAQQALDSTTSHELNHSIQFGYGALSGPNQPDAGFYEGGATWMEDEVFDGADDNYRYLWPDPADDMGEYRDNDPLGNPYGYWVVFRAMTEPFGTGLAGGGEQIMQGFWELTSRNEAGSLDAMDRALKDRGTTLADAFHGAGIALKFNRPCGGGFVLPHCLEEGLGYVAAKGPTPLHGQVSTIPGSVEGSVPDNYALNWIGLPIAAPFQVRLRNASGGGGRLQASVACDTGSDIRVKRLPDRAGPEETVILRRFEVTGCQSAVAVITNVAHTAANPSSSTARPYRLTVAPPARWSRTRLRVSVRPEEIVAWGRLKPAHPGERMRISLFERDGSRWDRIDTDRPPLRRGRTFRTEFDRPPATRCRVEARFAGDLDHLPSKRAKVFAC